MVASILLPKLTKKAAELFVLRCLLVLMGNSTKKGGKKNESPSKSK